VSGLALRDRNFRQYPGRHTAGAAGEQLGWRPSFEAIVALQPAVDSRPVLGGSGPAASRSAASGAGLNRIALQKPAVLMHSQDLLIISVGTFVRYGTHAALQTLWRDRF